MCFNLHLSPFRIHFDVNCAARIKKSMPKCVLITPINKSQIIQKWLFCALQVSKRASEIQIKTNKMALKHGPERFQTRTGPATGSALICRKFNTLARTRTHLHRYIPELEYVTFPSNFYPNILLKHEHTTHTNTAHDTTDWLFTVGLAIFDFDKFESEWVIHVFISTQIWVDYTKLSRNGKDKIRVISNKRGNKQKWQIDSNCLSASVITRLRNS